jgi:hypothetical protein
MILFSMTSVSLKCTLKKASETPLELFFYYIYLVAI